MSVAPFPDIRIFVADFPVGGASHIKSPCGQQSKMLEGEMWRMITVQMNELCLINGKETPPGNTEKGRSGGEIHVADIKMQTPRTPRCYASCDCGCPGYIDPLMAIHRWQSLGGNPWVKMFDPGSRRRKHPVGEATKQQVS